MTLDTLKDIEKLEGDLWDAADELRANSKLTANEYCMPLLRRHLLCDTPPIDTTKRCGQIEAIQAAGKMPKRPL